MLYMSRLTEQLKHIHSSTETLWEQKTKVQVYRLEWCWNLEQEEEEEERERRDVWARPRNLEGPEAPASSQRRTRDGAKT